MRRHVVPLFSQTNTAGLLLISALSKPVENLAILALPLAAITVLLDLRFPGSRLLGEDAGWELRLHVLTSMLASQASFVFQ